MVLLKILISNYSNFNKYQKFESQGNAFEAANFFDGKKWPETNSKLLDIKFINENEIESVKSSLPNKPAFKNVDEKEKPAEKAKEISAVTAFNILENFFRKTDVHPCIFWQTNKVKPSDKTQDSKLDLKDDIIKENADEDRVDEIKLKKRDLKDASRLSKKTSSTDYPEISNEKKIAKYREEKKDLKHEKEKNAIHHPDEERKSIKQHDEKKTGKDEEKEKTDSSTRKKDNTVILFALI